jgi:hypothetical protein
MLDQRRRAPDEPRSCGTQPALNAIARYFS